MTDSFLRALVTVGTSSLADVVRLTRPGTAPAGDLTGDPAGVDSAAEVSAPPRADEPAPDAATQQPDRPDPADLTGDPAGVDSAAEVSAPARADESAPDAATQQPDRPDPAGSDRLPAAPVEPVGSVGPGRAVNAPVATAVPTEPIAGAPAVAAAAPLRDAGIRGTEVVGPQRSVHARQPAVPGRPRPADPSSSTRDTAANERMESTWRDLGSRLLTAHLPGRRPDRTTGSGSDRAAASGPVGTGDTADPPGPAPTCAAAEGATSASSVPSDQGVTSTRGITPAGSARATAPHVPVRPAHSVPPAGDPQPAVPDTDAPPPGVSEIQIDNLDVRVVLPAPAAAPEAGREATSRRGVWDPAVRRYLSRL